MKPGGEHGWSHDTDAARFDGGGTWGAEEGSEPEAKSLMNVEWPGN